MAEKFSVRRKHTVTHFSNYPRYGTLVIDAWLDGKMILLVTLQPDEIDKLRDLLITRDDEILFAEKLGV